MKQRELVLEKVKEKLEKENIPFKEPLSPSHLNVWYKGILYYFISMPESKHLQIKQRESSRFYNSLHNQMLDGDEDSYYELLNLEELSVTEMLEKHIFNHKLARIVGRKVEPSLECFPEVLYLISQTVAIDKWEKAKSKHFIKDYINTIERLTEAELLMLEELQGETGIVDKGEFLNFVFQGLLKGEFLINDIMLVNSSTESFETKGRIGAKTFISFAIADKEYYVEYEAPLSFAAPIKFKIRPMEQVELAYQIAHNLAEF